MKYNCIISLKNNVHNLIKNRLLLKNANHCLRLQWVLVVTSDITDSLIIDYYNKFNEKVWNIVRITKMWCRNTNWATGVGKIALTIFLNVKLPPTVNLLKNKTKLSAKQNKVSCAYVEIISSYIGSSKIYCCCCCSVTQSCPALCNTIYCRTQGSLSLSISWSLPSSRSLHQWCHPAISSSEAIFSCCPQSFPASETFPISHLFASDDQNTRASVAASVLPVNIQGWSPLRLTGLISLLSKGLLGVFSSTAVQKYHCLVMVKGLVLLSDAMSHAMQGHPRWTGNSREVWQNMIHWKREWQTTLVYLYKMPKYINFTYFCFTF